MSLKLGLLTRDYGRIRRGRDSVYARKVELFSTVDTARYNLNCVVDCISGSEDIDYFLVPGFTSKRFRVAVFEKHRRGFLDLLLNNEEINKHLYVYWKHKGEAKVARLDSDIFNTTALYADVIRVFKYVSTRKANLLADEEFGCDIEFWLTGEEFIQHEDRDRILSNIKLGLYGGYDFKGCWVARRQNKYAGVIPPESQMTTTIDIEGRPYNTLGVFTEPHLSDITFPIDVVYTWVDSSDEGWIADFNKYKSLIGGNIKNNSASRYEDRDELKYSLRSLYMYGSSFVRNIYIVTNGQVPRWLNTDHPRIHLVAHREIFKDKSALPTFSSRAINSQLHNIKGLSDNYIYFNDDVFLGRHVDAQHFFHPSGIMKVMLSKAQIGVGAPSIHESSPSSAGKNVKKLLYGSFGVAITNKLRHAPCPQNKALLKEISTRYESAVKETMFSRFRDVSDIELAGTFQHSYALINGRSVETDYPSITVDISSKDSKGELDNILRRRAYDVICLNESDTPDDAKRVVDENVRDFMQAYYPLASPYEKNV